MVEAGEDLNTPTPVGFAGASNFPFLIQRPQHCHGVHFHWLPSLPTSEGSRVWAGIGNKPTVQREQDYSYGSISYNSFQSASCDVRELIPFTIPPKPREDHTKCSSAHSALSRELNTELLRLITRCKPIMNFTEGLALRALAVKPQSFYFFPYRRKKNNWKIVVLQRKVLS